MESLANIEFYGPILAGMAGVIAVLGLHIRVLHEEAKASAREHAQQIQAIGDAHAAQLRALAEEYNRRFEIIAAAHAAKLDEIGVQRAEQAREMVDTLLSIQESRAEEQRALNTALNALESTMSSVKESVTSLSERTIEHLIKARAPRRPTTNT